MEQSTYFLCSIATGPFKMVTVLVYCEEGQCAYFTKYKAIVDEYAKPYREGVIE
jgi:hypothetical protein